MRAVRVPVRCGLSILWIVRMRTRPCHHTRLGAYVIGDRKGEPPYYAFVSRAGALAYPAVYVVVQSTAQLYDPTVHSYTPPFSAVLRARVLQSPVAEGVGVA